MFSMKWIINNSWLSFAQSQGDTYWKGFFIQCRTDYSVGGITCHNYQFPWFLMDGVLLSNRILYVLAWIFMIAAQGLSFLAGNWNAISISNCRSTLSNLHKVISLMYFLIGTMLVFVTAVVTKVIHRQYRGDSKIGPMNSFVHEDNSFKHEVEYEFGMAFYWNIALSGVIIIQAVIYAWLNPYARTQEQILQDDLKSDI